MSDGRPATGVGSSTPFRIMRSLPARSVTSIVEAPLALGRNTMLHGWLSPFVTVILMGRTRAVSIVSGPSASGGDGQLIPGGAVAPRPPPAAPCPRPPPAGAGGAPCCCAEMAAAANSSPQALIIARRIRTLRAGYTPIASRRSHPRLEMSGLFRQNHAL